MDKRNFIVGEQSIPIYSVPVEVIESSTLTHTRHDSATVVQSVITSRVHTVIPGAVHTTEEQQIWVRDSAGKESQVNLWNRDLPVRTGHKLSLTWIGSRTGAPFHVSNETTGQVTFGSIDKLAEKVGFNPLQGWVGSSAGGWVSLPFVLTVLMLIASFALPWFFNNPGRSTAYKLCLYTGTSAEVVGTAILKAKGPTNKEQSVDRNKVAACMDRLSPPGYSSWNEYLFYGRNGEIYRDSGLVGAAFLFIFWIVRRNARAAAKREFGQSMQEKFKSAVLVAISRRDLGVPLA